MVCWRALSRSRQGDPFPFAVGLSAVMGVLDFRSQQEPRRPAADGQTDETGAGWRRSPVGTTAMKRYRLNRPYGTERRSCVAIPSDESLGYYAPPVEILRPTLYDNAPRWNP